MSTSDLSNRLHRVVKLAIDSGEVASIEEAQRLFAGYQLMIEAGPAVAASPTLQAALLTAVNAGRRCFLGGVCVAGDLDVNLRVPWQRCHTLAEAVIQLQGQIVDVVIPEVPRILIGSSNVPADVGEFAVHTTFNGWSGAVVPADGTQRLSEQMEFTPSGVLAGALAVSEAFQHVRGNILAGRRSEGLSLWQLGEAISWLDADPGPPLEILPNALWLIGLGHLGQAYLWLLGFLPYAQPENVRLVLQDTDSLVEANDSTSMLTDMSLIGKKKTRAMAQWCEQRGFQTKVNERRFKNNFTVADEEPQVALCGVDNALARAALEDVGFRWILEAGLGRGTREYLAFQVHTFPAERMARDRWASLGDGENMEKTVQQPAYQALKGIDQCGLTQLAGRTVGAPFVGTATAAVMVAELLRMMMGAHRNEIIDGSLRTLDDRLVVPSDLTPGMFNPGYTMAGAEFCS